MAKPTIEQDALQAAASYEAGQPNAEPSDSSYTAPSAQELADSEREATLEAQYGDNELEAAAGAAANASTFGASDVLLKQLGVPEERLRESRERSPASAAAGTVTGVVGPALLSGGSSLVAKAAAKTPIGLSIAAGKAAEKATEATLKSIVGNSARAKILAKLAPKAAALATEGAALGAGQNLSEAAIGNADLNAESLLANAGVGAMLNLGFGAGLGGAKAAVPVVKKGIAPIAAKIKNTTAGLFDAEAAALELSGISKKTAAKLAKKDPTFSKDLKTYFQENLGITRSSSQAELAAANDAAVEAAGGKIGKISKDLDAITQERIDLQPVREEVYDNLLNNLTEEYERLKIAPAANRAELRTVRKYADDVMAARAKQEPLTFKELDELRKTYQSKAYRDNKELKGYSAEVAEKLRGALRNEVDTIADRVAKSNIKPELAAIGNDLKRANRDFYIGKKLQGNIDTRSERGLAPGMRELLTAGVLAPIDFGLAAAGAAATKFANSDLRRRLSILADTKANVDGVSTAVTDAMKSFFSRTGRSVKPLSTKMLMESGLSVDAEKRERPKTRVEAFKNLTKNLGIVKSEDGLLIDRIATATSRLQQAAPNTAAMMSTTMVNALNFLDQKLPRTMNTTSEFGPKRDYQPSSLELSKFERYLQAVEAPISVLDDLERGTITREHVEAIKAVYPTIYRMMQQEVMDQMAENSDKISYGKRIQLGILLDVPTDETLKPEAISYLQANFADQNAPPPPGAIKPTQSGVSGIDKAARETTDTQQTAARRLV